MNLTGEKFSTMELNNETIGLSKNVTKITNDSTDLKADFMIVVKRAKWYYCSIWTNIIQI